MKDITFGEGEFRYNSTAVQQYDSTVGNDEETIKKSYAVYLIYGYTAYYDRQISMQLLLIRADVN